MERTILFKDGEPCNIGQKIKPPSGDRVYVVTRIEKIIPMGDGILKVALELEEYENKEAEKWF